MHSERITFHSMIPVSYRSMLLGLCVSVHDTCKQVRLAKPRKKGGQGQKNKNRNTRGPINNPPTRLSATRPHDTVPEYRTTPATSRLQCHSNRTTVPLVTKPNPYHTGALPKPNTICTSFPLSIPPSPSLPLPFCSRPPNQPTTTGFFCLKLVKPDQ